MNQRSDNCMAETARSIAEDFSYLENWEDRFGHIIALGRQMEADSALPASDRHDGNLVPGCTSRVWMTCRVARDDRLIFCGSSDSILVSGLISILVALYSQRTPTEILNFDAQTFLTGIGLDRALTTQRANGLFAMHRRIEHHARSAAGL